MREERGGKREEGGERRRYGEDVGGAAGSGSVSRPRRGGGDLQEIVDFRIRNRLLHYIFKCIFRFLFENLSYIG